MKRYLLSALLLCSAQAYSALDITIEGISPYKIDELYELYEEAPDYIFTDHILKNRVYYQQKMRSYLNKLDKDIAQIDVTLIKKSGKAAGLFSAAFLSVCVGRWMFFKAWYLNSLAKPTSRDQSNEIYLLLFSFPTQFLSIPLSYFGAKRTYDAVTYKTWLMERYDKGHKILVLLQDAD